jgi:hypothetical protein
LKAIPSEQSRLDGVDNSLVAVSITGIVLAQVFVMSKGNAMATGVGCYMDRRYDLVGRQVDLLHGSPPVAGHRGEFLIGWDRDLDRSRAGGNFRDDGQFLWSMTLWQAT